MLKPFPAILMLGTLTPLAADQVRTSDGGVISGRITGLDATALSLESEHAPQPIRIKPEQIRSVSFAEDAVQRGDHDARIVLINGDRLPCDIQEIDSGHVVATTGFSDALRIPRESIASVQLGIRPREIVYQGPTREEDWKIADAWRFENETLISVGKGSASRTIEDLPRSFSLQFRIHWNQAPNLEFYFCSSENRAGGGKLDRYYLQFNSAGFGIQRQSSGDTTYQSLGNASLTPDDFSDSEALVEIRVDRRIRRIELMIDGEIVGRFHDPLPEAPEGDGFILSSNSQASDVHEIRDIVVRAWSANRDRHDSEDRGDAPGDSLIDHSGQRFTGKLLGTTKEKSATLYLFESPHQPDPIRIPANQVSTLFFAKPDPKAARPPMIIGLHEHGLLSVAACTFTGERMNLSHPLLGDLSLDRTALTSMARRQDEPTTEP